MSKNARRQTPKTQTLWVYIDVYWLHDLADEPYRLISEIDQSDFETRKIEFFRGGNIGWASKKNHTLGTKLGIVEVPTIEEINSDSEFEGIEITASAFEKLWKQYVQSNS